MTVPASVDALFAEVVGRLDRVDLLFNNAGVTSPPRPMDEIDLDEWRSVIDTNVTGSFLCARAAFRQMRRQVPAGGRIINNGSLSAEVPRAYSAPYTTSKHAITGLTRSIALDGRRHGIACGQINVGNADTSLLDEFGAVEFLQADGTASAEPRINVDDVAAAVLYMAKLPLSSNVLFMTVMATAMPSLVAAKPASPLLPFQRRWIHVSALPYLPSLLTTGVLESRTSERSFGVRRQRLVTPGGSRTSRSELAVPLQRGR